MTDLPQFTQRKVMGHVFLTAEFLAATSSRAGLRRLLRDPRTNRRVRGVLYAELLKRRPRRG